MGKLTRYTILLIVLSTTLVAQGIRDSAQRINTGLSSVTSQGFYGTILPGSVPGNLSGDVYLYTPGGGNPAVPYICGAVHGTATPACTSIAAGQWQALTIPMVGSLQYDVVGNYHAAASNTTTTGTMVSGQSTLTVASVSTFITGHGVLAVGCVATSLANPVGNLIGTITAISGTQLTLNTTATADCTGVLVAHDDTTAANAANAACMNNGGGLIWFRSSGVDGIYKFSAPANTTTGGILTWPQNLTAQNPVHCRVVGEALGNIIPGDLSLQTGGVSWDFSNAPNVAGTWAMSSAPYVPTTSENFTTSFNSLDVEVDEINIWMPAHTAISGLMFYNQMQADVRKVYVGPKADSSGIFNQPQSGTVGLRMPGWLNNIQEYIGLSAFYGFDHCVEPGEHAYLDGPYMVDCLAALYLYTAHDLISGHMKIEGVPLMLKVDAGVTNRIPIDLTWDNETCITTGPTCAQSWQVRGTYDLVDPNNILYGSLRYKIKDVSENYLGINKNGGANLTYCDMGVASSSNSCVP